MQDDLERQPSRLRIFQDAHPLDEGVIEKKHLEAVAYALKQALRLKAKG